MRIPFVERKIRASLSFYRFMQNALPLSMSPALLKKGTARVQMGPDIVREAVTLDGVSCEWIYPRTSSTEQVLLYLHGGGFVYGQTPLHLKMGAYLAQKTNLRALMVDYRTAPNDPFPAALDDCFAAYLWLLKHEFSPKNIVVAGDSAGGNLVLTTMYKLRDGGYPLPAAAVCLSPVTDLTPEADRRKGFKDPLLSPKSMQFYNQAYLGQADPHNPLISPVLGDLQGFPPLLIFAGEDEILLDDAVRIADLAKASGVDVRLEIYPRMWHVWQLYLALPQATQSLDDIALFIKTHLPEISS